MKKYNKIIATFLLVFSLSLVGVAGINSASADYSTSTITPGTVAENYEPEYYVIATDYAIKNVEYGYGDFFIPGTTVISSGSYGEYVKACQAGMRKVHVFHTWYNCWVDDVDSSFGPKTKTAVMNFQSTVGVDVDGYVGRQTWYQLQEKCWNQ